MGLASDIAKVLVKSIGTPSDPAKILELSQGLSDAIIDFLQKQTFTITEMKSVLEVEELSTTGPIQADVPPKTLLGPHAPVIGALKSLGIDIESPIGKSASNVSKGGAVIPKLDFKKDGGQGGAMKAVGHAYIGRNPVDSDESNEDLTKVKLLDENIIGR